MQNSSAPTFQAAAAETRTPRFSRWLRAFERTLLTIAAIFLALHFVHLSADFPNYSFWKDWAKFTDEGWYGDAAIRHYQLGHWNLPGDFNPAAALPIWPFLEFILFRFTGVSLVAGRALTVSVFSLTLLCCFFLLRHWSPRRTTGNAGSRASLAPAVIVTLLAVSPFCFAFTRIAILEPLLVLEMVLALLIATWAGESLTASRDPPSLPPPRPILWITLLGLVFPAMVLTKTTGLFLFPAILWTLWAATNYRLAPFVRIAASSAAIGAALWIAYYWLLIRPRYKLDFWYLFSANAYTGFKWNGLAGLLFDTTYDSIWIGKPLFPIAFMAVVGAVILLPFKKLRAAPIQVTMLLWILGYGAFLTYHANLQPRYYLVLAVPLTALAVLFFEPLFIHAVRSFGRSTHGPQAAPVRALDTVLLRGAASIIAFALAFAGISAARQTLGFVLHPDYTWINAAARIREAVEREAASSRARGVVAHPRLVLSISGANLSLMTGLPSICDDFGTMTLNDRIAAYKPGWFATWNEVEDDKMEALSPTYRLERVLAAPAFDDPDRNLLILYRLDPLPIPGPRPPPGHRRTIFVPKSMRTQIGEQPTADQLRH